MDRTNLLGTVPVLPLLKSGSTNGTSWVEF